MDGSHLGPPCPLEPGTVAQYAAVVGLAKQAMTQQLSSHCCARVALHACYLVLAAGVLPFPVALVVTKV